MYTVYNYDIILNYWFWTCYAMSAIGLFNKYEQW